MKPTEAKSIIKNIEWFKANDVVSGSFVSLCYSRKQHFGATDYKDHRADTIEELKSLMEKGIIDGCYQRVHFFKSDGRPYTKIAAKGYNGGYTAYFVE